MAENNEIVAAEPQPTEKARRHCTGDCMKCIPFQRQYCAAQLGYNNMRLLESLTTEMRHLREKVEALQNNESLLFNPHEDDIAAAEPQSTDMAQEGDGA